VPGDELREVHLDLRWRAVHGPGTDVGLNGRLHRLREVVAVQQGPVPHHVVEIAVAVGVDDVSTVAVVDEEGVRHRRPHRGVDAAGEDRQRPVVQFPGFVVVHAYRSVPLRKECTGFREKSRG